MSNITNSDFLHYGICNLSIVPVRSESSDKSELCTQLLFGDAYTILEISENKKWLKIKIIFDEYEGWIDAIQHFEVSENHFEAYLMTKHGFCYDDVALVETQNNTSLIHFGSVLPFQHGFSFTIGKDAYTFEGDIQSPINDNSFENNIRFLAFRFINTPYLWGGKTRFGIDCSGFTQQIYRMLGFSLCRDAYQQATQGKEIIHVDEAKIGDLLFFENKNKKIIHVGIYIDTKKIIHAHGKVRIDFIDKKGILNADSRLYTHDLACIRRYCN